jgi:murein DD-endopeptidase MepM/ murein hydrolase activator NlpD
MQAYALSPMPNFANVNQSRRKRENRLRTSWFVLGILAGIFLGLGISWLMRPDHLPATSPAIEQEQFSQNNSASPSTTATVASKPESQPLVNAVPTPKPSEPEKQIAYPRDVELKIERGDTLLKVLLENNLPQEEAFKVVDSLKKKYNPSRLNTGQTLNMKLDRIENGAESETGIVLASLKFTADPTSRIHLERKDNGEYAAERKEVPTFKRVALGKGKIRNSLYQTGQRLGVPPQVIAQMINAMSYDVDFQREISAGDDIEILYERTETEDGKIVSYGNLLYASLDKGNDTVTVYRYTDSTGFTDYFNEKGESVRKALLRTPINGARVSSGFGMRKHPILGYSKMHRGMDFAAPTGTPIYAAGDGIVAFMGPYGAYGNYIRLKHPGSKYETAYAHLRSFARGVRRGSQVKQGQIIGYVGTTGRSTGPHLHYEILVNGVQINPAGVKFRTGTVLAGRELRNFQNHKRSLHTMVASMPQSMSVAMNDTENKSGKN